MKAYIQDIEALAVKNEDFRQVLYTAKYCQLVVMALKTMMNSDSPSLLAGVRKARTAACIHWAPIFPAEPDAAKGENPVSATAESVQLRSPGNSTDSVDSVVTGETSRPT